MIQKGCPCIKSIKKIVSSKNVNIEIGSFYIGQVKRSQLLSAANTMYRLAQVKNQT